MGSIEEIRKGTEVKRKIMNYLVRRYDLVRKGTTTVSTCLKNKIQFASTKIRTFVGKYVALRQNNLLKKQPEPVVQRARWQCNWWCQPSSKCN